MKKIQLLFPVLLLTVILLGACQRDAAKEMAPPVQEQVTTGISTESEEEGPCNSDAYVITLESKTFVNGNWEWVWSVQNPNPGSGLNGTVQDMSHWGMQFGTCFSWAAITGGAYSYDNVNWTSFTPSYSPDPSQLCLTTPVLKFNYGTYGGAKTYYKLILNQDYNYANALAYYKSGRRTGCCTALFQGIGCLNGDEDGNDR